MEYGDVPLLAGGLALLIDTPGAGRCYTGVSEVWLASVMGTSEIWSC
jgi:hypothetical protein